MKIFFFILTVYLLIPAAALGQACEPLPPPTGNIVDVDTTNELVYGIVNANPGDTILVADGTYNLNGAYLWIDTPNLTLRSKSGNAGATILDGNYVTTEIVTIAASNVTIADLTLKRAYTHPIHVVPSSSGGSVNALMYNVHIIDPGEQAIKINQYNNFFADFGEIACSRIELTDAGRAHIRNNCYTGGVDAHQARGWVIRDNTIEGFWCEDGLSEHAIHFWRGSRDTVVERNVLVDNARGIGFGLTASGSGRTYSDNPCPDAEYVGHYRGIIRNNFIYQNRQELNESQYGFDCGICLAQACDTKVFHNTVVSTAAPFSSIEWRFSDTDATITNNLVSHNLRERGGARASLTSNLDYQPLSLFVDGAGGDLHLKENANVAIDKGVPIGDNLCYDDIDGDHRDIKPDIGADEIVESLNIKHLPMIPLLLLDDE